MSLLERDAINRAEGSNNKSKEVSMKLVSMGFPEDKIAEIVNVPIEIVSQWLNSISPT